MTSYPKTNNFNSLHEFKAGDKSITSNSITLKLDQFVQSDAATTDAVNTLTSALNTATNDINTTNTNVTNLQETTTNIVYTSGKTTISGQLNMTEADYGNVPSSIVIGRYCAPYMTGGSNIVIGRDSGKNAAFSGQKSVILGTWCGTSISSSYYNVAIGYGSDCVGGGGSTALGANAVASSNSVAIGRLANTGTSTNVCALGYQAGVGYSGNNRVYLGNSSITGIYANVTSITSLSDARDKQQIQDIPFDCTEYINQLEPKIYKLNPRNRYVEHCDEGEGVHTCSQCEPEGSKADTHYSIGLVAQDLQTVENIVGVPNNIALDEISNDTLGVKYASLIPILIQALKESNSRIDELEFRIQSLE